MTSYQARIHNIFREELGPEYEINVQENLAFFGYSGSIRYGSNNVGFAISNLVLSGHDPDGALRISAKEIHGFFTK